MAWIPKPCGLVRLSFNGEEELGEEVNRGPTTTVSSVWRQQIGTRQGVEEGEVGLEVWSRFSGLVSQLNAAVLSGQRAGRYS